MFAEQQNLKEYQERINVVVLVNFKALCDDSKQLMKPCQFLKIFCFLCQESLTDFEGHDLNENRIPILINCLIPEMISFPNKTFLKKTSS